MIHKVFLNLDKKYSLRSFQVIIELFRFFYLIGISQFIEGYTQIKESVPISDDEFFYDGDINTISEQKQKFDKVIGLKTDLNSNSNLNQNQPIHSEEILRKLQTRRRIYSKEVFNDVPNVFDIQSKFLDYDQQIKNTKPEINQLYEVQVAPQQNQRHQDAFNSILNEQIFFQKLSDYYKSNLSGGYQHLTKHDINSLQDFLVMNSKMDLNETIDLNKLALLHDLDGKQ
jgi:hypothetical protein